MEKLSSETTTLTTESIRQDLQFKYVDICSKLLLLSHILLFVRKE